MDLTSIFVVAIIFTASYKTIELLVRRKERLILIAKMQPGDEAIKLPQESEMNLGRFTSLRVGALLCGLGLGLVVGYLLSLNMYENYDGVGIPYHEFKSAMTGGSVLFCGGFGMLISFVIERLMRKKS